MDVCVYTATGDFECVTPLREYYNSNNPRFATMVLTRGYTDPSEYDRMLIPRNKAIAKWAPVDMDHLIFHEGNIPAAHHQYILERSPASMHIIFVNVANLFDPSKDVPCNDVPQTSACQCTPLSNSFSLGYKHMCHFWFIDFLRYVRGYKFVIRVDEDCIVHSSRSATCCKKWLEMD